MVKSLKSISFFSFLLVVTATSSLSPPLLAQALHPVHLDAGDDSPVLRRLRSDHPLFQTGSPVPNLARAIEGSTVAPVPPTKPGEVEPIVLGRPRWNDGNASAPVATAPGGIRELPPIETDQQKPDDPLMPLKPPVIPPAVTLNRNFEGTLVLKTKTLGVEKEFPFQLQTGKGHRLAYVDVSGVKAVDPVGFRNRRVTILGRLEPIKENGKSLIIRARLIRVRD